MADTDCRSSQPQPRPQPRPQSHWPCAQNSHAAVAANETRRRQKHGRLHPMHKPTLLERLLGRG